MMRLRTYGIAAGRLLLLLIAATIASPLARGQGGATFDFQHLFLAPKISPVGVDRIFYFGETPGYSEQYGTLESELHYAQRMSIAAAGRKAGGARITWFTFDQDVDYSGIAFGGPDIQLSGGTNLDVDAIDAELTQAGRLGQVAWLASAGARYGRVSLRELDINFEDLVDAIWFGSTGVKFEGAGPTLALQGERLFRRTGVSFFGTVRTSLLFGDTDLWSAFNDGGSYSNPDDIVQVWELQLGSKFEQRYEGHDFFAGIFWEAQRWDSESDHLGDLGFHGFGVSTGIRY